MKFSGYSSVNNMFYEVRNINGSYALFCRVDLGSGKKFIHVPTATIYPMGDSMVYVVDENHEFELELN